MIEIKACGYKSVIVEMTHADFEIITGSSIGDEYGNRGYSWKNAEGKRFDIGSIKTMTNNIKNLLALRNKTNKELINIVDGFNRATFPFSEYLDNSDEK